MQKVHSPSLKEKKSVVHSSDENEYAPTMNDVFVRI